MFQPGELAGAAADVLASGRHDQLVFRAAGQLAEGQNDGNRAIAQYLEALKVDPKFLHVAFASAAVPASAFADVDRSRFAPDDFAAGKRELYLWYANGSGRSKMDLNVPGVRHIDFTARNWNTVVKLRDLASGP